MVVKSSTILFNGGLDPLAAAPGVVGGTCGLVALPYSPGSSEKYVICPPFCPSSCSSHNTAVDGRNSDAMMTLCSRREDMSSVDGRAADGGVVYIEGVTSHVRRRVIDGRRLAGVFSGETVMANQSASTVQSTFHLSSVVRTFTAIFTLVCLRVCQRLYLDSIPIDSL